MRFAEEQVSKYINRIIPTFYNVRLNQLLDYLPCLTKADKEKIQRDIDREGNSLSVQGFFDILYCRSQWVEQLIFALQSTNSLELAEDIRRVYDSVQCSSQQDQTSRSPPGVTQDSQLPVSVPVGPSTPSSDDSPLSPPHNQPRPTPVPLPTPAPSASLQVGVDWRPPVQETKLPSQSNETASEAKSCRNDIKRNISTPDQCNRNAAEFDAGLAAQHENLISVQAPSPKSLVEPQTPLGQVCEEEVRSSTPISSRSDADFSSSSSTDVIPPSSPAAFSATLSDVNSMDLKPPVQERDLWTASKKMMGNGPLKAPSYVTDNPANARENRNNANTPSRHTNVFFSNREEEDISLLKPGVLVSRDITGESCDKPLSNRGEEYSGTPDRFRCSGKWSEGSDSLMLSDSTKDSRSKGSERNMTGSNSSSLHHQNDDHSDGGSIRTHMVHTEEPPSVDNTRAPEMIHLALGNINQPPGDFLDFVAGDQMTENSNSCHVHSDSRRNSRQYERCCAAASLSWSDPMLLAIGFTLTSLLAFVLYKQLKK